ncbi:hypothetical protein MSMEI_4449 [Mycolicibacterium smegmatis MC2 155]|uniref:Uncharacterized protein n=1 Tax=Mycolicibacterium smegmatis (strain ATCC 700084 / mc(2)155) TaxID=246196 RepID=I7FQC6_MYCS2|nr:hypothetical protein MSMEI_4449 [Mycolicibacterium smegmatis MC2 155]
MQGPVAEPSTVDPATGDRTRGGSLSPLRVSSGFAPDSPEVGLPHCNSSTAAGRPPGFRHGASNSWDRELQEDDCCTSRPQSGRYARSGPGGGVAPGATPPDSAQTSGLGEPAPRPKHKITPTAAVSGIGLVLFLALFIAAGVLLILNMTGVFD